MENLIILDSDKRNFPSSNKILSLLYKYLEKLYFNFTYNVWIIPKIKKYKISSLIIAVDEETRIILNKHKIKFTDINEYINEKDYLSYEKKTIEFIRNLPKSFPEIDLKYKDISLWKVDESDIYHSFFKPLILEIEIIHKIINKEKTKRLIIFDSNSKLGKIQKEFDGKVKIIDKTNFLSKLKNRFMRLFIGFAIKTIDFSFRKKIKQNKHKPKKTKEVIFFSSERGLKYLFSVFKKVNKISTILQHEQHEKKSSYFDYDFYQNYINKKSKKNILSLEEKLKNSLKRIKNSKRLKCSLKYKDINIYRSAEEMFKYLFINSYLKSSFYYECFNNMLNYSNPKLIVNMCEENKAVKIMLNLSKKYGIKSLFIMHGTFGKYYLYDHLLSNQTAVYGIYYKKILKEINKSKPKIIITGNPAWDHLAKQNFDEKKILHKLNLTDDKKIILFATINFPKDIRERLAHCVIRNMIKLKNHSLIIKLHPEEESSLYYKLLKKYDVNAVIVDDLSMLHPLISISDAVIIHNSTVGLETLMLNKPLIDINLTKEPHYHDYVEKDVALSVRNEEELLPAIKAILNNKKVKEKLEKNRKKYVYKHAYKQDGKASERVVKLIQEMIKE